MGKKKIMIVDDDKAFGRLTKLQLESDVDYEVIVETNPENAIDAAEASKPDVILLDVMMPQKNGILVLKELKHNRKTAAIPVIMLSSLDKREIKLTAAREYSEHYIVKSHDAGMMKSKIEALIQLRGPQAEKTEKDEKKPLKEPAKTTVKKILIIDDEAGVCEFLKIFLSSLGFNVTVCSDSTKAISIFRSEKPEIVILDLVMPEIDGTEILQGMKELRTKARVIIATAIHDSAILKDVIELGADDILIKPFSLDQVHATVEKHLNLMGRDSRK